MQSNDGGSAFPRPFNHEESPSGEPAWPGLSYRDYAAIKIAASIWSSAGTMSASAQTAESHGRREVDVVALLAYEQADALIRWREHSQAETDVERNADGRLVWKRDVKQGEEVKLTLEQFHEIRGVFGEK